MGSCNSQERVLVVNTSKPNSTSGGNQFIEGDTPNASLRNFIDPKFQDMPEWDGDRHRGEGVKRMKGYKCDLQIDKLNQLREDFWNLKLKEKMIWKHLRQACLMDDGNLFFKDSQSHPHTQTALS
jgi:hypothetical protein